jgi:GNAT superfamily N-acetyltransferase
VPSASVDLLCVDPEKVFDFWPYARGLIKTAVDATNLSDFADIENDVLNGDQLLWLAWSQSRHIEAAATTHLSRKVCTLTACSGHDRGRWLPLFAHIEKYAKDEGCSAMRIYGRKGWERVLDGYRVEHVVLEKAL